MGWAEFRNGDLLLDAEARFDALVTTDQNFRFQQNLANRRLAILVLPFASWPKLERHKSKIVAAIEALQPGDYRDLTLPNSSSDGLRLYLTLRPHHRIPSFGSRRR